MPFVHGEIRSDGKTLLDRGRWVLLGHTPGWLAAAVAEPDPNAATSVAPPGC